MILYGEPKEKVIQFLKDKISELKEGKYSVDEITLPKTLGDEIYNYKVTNPHRDASIYMNNNFNGNFSKGSRVTLIYVKSSGKYPSTRVIALMDGWTMPKDFIIDIDKMIDKNVYEIITRIFDALDWNISEIRGQTSMNRWFR